MKIEERIEGLGLKLPNPPKAAAQYVPALVCGKLVFVAGQTPKEGTRLLYKGKLGKDLSIEDGKKAAEICVMRCISAVKDVVGNLDRVKGIAQITGYVNSTEDFEEHSLVINGASNLLEKIFEEKGRHSRVAVGMTSLPGKAAVELQMIAIIE